MATHQHFELTDYVHNDSEIMSGATVFRGTRVHAKTLFDYLRAGDSIEVFLDHFPTVTREQAVGLLDVFRRAVSDDARPT